jgi:hypothetical protein
MTPRALATAAALAAALSSLPVAAQSRPDEGALFGGEPEQKEAPPPSSRPSEDNMFGDSSESEAPPAIPPAGPPGGEPPGRVETRDEQALGAPTAQEAFGSEEHVDDPLKIGGQFYLRAIAQGNEGVSFGSTSFSAPTLVDGYFDARPTDRLRGMVVGRLSFDPTISGQSTSFLGTSPSDGSSTPPLRERSCVTTPSSWRVCWQHSPAKGAGGG